MLEIALDTFQRISAIARRRWGIHLTDRKLPLVANRVSSYLAATRRFATIDEYVRHLEERGDERDMLVFFDVLSTNVTSFFRDPQHFHLLERDFWTPLLHGVRPAHGGAIRMWSAGCSVGCEPYSMAIQALEMVGGRSGWDVRVLATDLSSKALAAARAAEYDEAVTSSIDPAVRGRHFLPVEDARACRWRVAPAARSMVRVRRLNLVEEWPFQGPFDVIFVRNVMIYFDEETRQRVIRRMADRLRPGGFLAVGSAETLSGLDVPLKPIGASVYTK